MKLASFIHAGQPRYGQVLAERFLLPPAEFLARHPDLLSVLRAQALGELEQALQAGAVSVDAAQTQALPVIPTPASSSAWA